MPTQNDPPPWPRSRPHNPTHRLRHGTALPSSVEGRVDQALLVGRGAVRALRARAGRVDIRVRVSPTSTARGHEKVERLMRVLVAVGVSRSPPGVVELAVNERGKEVMVGGWQEVRTNTANCQHSPGRDYVELTRGR